MEPEFTVEATRFELLELMAVGDRLDTLELFVEYVVEAIEPTDGALVVRDEPLGLSLVK